MKLNEIQLYKGIGTIQMTLNDDGEKCYLYTHNFFGQSYEENTIKGAKEMLDFDEENARKIREAINVLKVRGYKVYKELG